jgi:methyl-accepting chemotaxis protein
MLSNMSIRAKNILTLILTVGVSVILMIISYSSVSSMISSQSKLDEVQRKLVNNKDIIASHEQYMGDLCRAFTNNEKLDSVSAYNSCSFGKWFYGFEKSSEFKKLPLDLREKFHSAETHHKRIHKIGQDFQNSYFIMDRGLNELFFSLQVAHLKWSESVSKSILQKGVLTAQTDHTACGLGKWYYKFVDTSDFKSLPTPMQEALKELEPIHKKLHQSAIKIKKHQQAGEHYSAGKVYQDETLKYLGQVEKIFEYNRDVVAKINKANKSIEFAITKEAPKEFEAVMDALTSYDEYLEELSTTLHKDSKDTQNSVNTTLVILFIVLAVAIIISLMVLKSINDSIKNITDASDRLAHSDDVHSRIEIRNNDETAVIAKNLNHYLDGIEKGINDDARFIEDVEAVMRRVENGWFSQHITAQTKNRALIELKQTINHSLDNLKDRITTINDLLDEYSKYDYRKELRIDGVEKNGVFDKLIINVNSLRDAINSMLVENKSNGLTMDISSNVLLENVDILNKNSNEAAASLEETAAALEEITSNIANNTENVVKMSGYANELTKSANEGETLAKDTTTAMTEIDTQVNAINEAITVIDQIAFQTNILSLNAAVEAATAGEAGKGFAVVAQEVRNLASRSAEAANEIKALVESATSKANDGKKISDKMISGYLSLNQNIGNTLELIKDIEMASKEQQLGIEQINDAVSGLDKQTQENAMVASKTHNVAIETDNIAKLIVSNANAKEFIGKDSVKPKKLSEESTHAAASSNHIKHIPAKSKSSSSSSSSYKAPTKPSYTPPPKQTAPVSSHDDDDWESF